MCKLEVLFDVKHATVSEHISNILASGELDETSVGFSDRSTGGRKPQIYNLNMILSVGYRVNSKRGIFEICSLTVACLTSNNTSSLHIQSFSSFYHSILLFRHQFFKPGTLDNNKLVCAFPFLQHFIHPEQTRTLARHNKQPSSNNRGIFFTLNSMKSRNYHSIFISKLLTD